MNPKALLNRFDAFQQRHRFLAVPMAVLKKSSDDQGGNLASLVAYYGFFSLFPLLLVFATIVGFVLSGDPHTQKTLEHSITSQFPSVGKLLPLKHISGSVIALVIGVLTSLYAGLGVTNAAQNLMNTVWAVPHKDRPNFVQSRVRGLGLLVFLGAMFIISTVVTGAVSSTFGGIGAKLAGYVVSLLVNGALFFAAFRLMTDDDVPSRDLRIGTAVASVLWTFLQSISAVYIHHVKTTTYGTFSTVILLIVWLHLGAQVFMYSAEVNVVTTRRLWPRSYFGPPTAAADREARAALAKTEERSEEQKIDVAFRDPPPPENVD
jgi:membrane protein